MCCFLPKLASLPTYMTLQILNLMGTSRSNLDKRLKLPCYSTRREIHALHGNKAHKYKEIIFQRESVEGDLFSEILEGKEFFVHKFQIPFFFVVLSFSMYWG